MKVTTKEKVRLQSEDGFPGHLGKEVRFKFGFVSNYHFATRRVFPGSRTALTKST